MSHATVFDVVDCSACKFAGRKDDYFLVTMAANKEFVVEEDAQFATFDMAFSPDGAKMLATHSLAYLGHVRGRDQSGVVQKTVGVDGR